MEYANLGEGQPGRFIVAQDDDAKAQFLLLNNHNSVVHINSEKQTIIGKINFEGGKKELELTIKEECFYWFWPLRPVVHMSFTKIEINAGRDAVMTGVTDGIK